MVSRKDIEEDGSLSMLTKAQREYLEKIIWKEVMKELKKLVAEKEWKIA